MFSRCLSLLACAMPLMAGPAALRICADPNNLPFSNQSRAGFENRIADIVSADLGFSLEYVWYSPKADLIQHTLKDRRCDLLLGVPAGISEAETTEPYYRSSYVFVSRRDRHLNLHSLADESLANLRIGLHMVGNDYAPPAVALARRGLAANLEPYHMLGPYGEPNPQARIIDAVVQREIDVAIVWGPMAGYFGKHSAVPLDIVPVSPEQYLTVPFTYSIAAAVPEGNTELRDRVQSVLARNRSRIKSLLQEYGVPLLPLSQGDPTGGG